MLNPDSYIKSGSKNIYSVQNKKLYFMIISPAGGTVGGFKYFSITFCVCMSFRLGFLITTVFGSDCMSYLVRDAILRSRNSLGTYLMG